jgi:two-component system chemotaxis response regulator CheB
MPPGFTKAFAERMDTLSPILVKEAEQGEAVKSGVVYIAPGDFQMKIVKSAKGKIIELDKSPQVNGHRPSVEVTFDSVRNVYGGENLAAAIMTGMGRDGAEAIKRIKDENGYTIAQNEETSVIYGMNRSAVEIGGIDKVVALQDIAGVILDIVKERE